MNEDGEREWVVSQLLFADDTALVAESHITHTFVIVSYKKKYCQINVKQMKYLAYVFTTYRPVHG